ncbi:radical SAM protein [Agarivorans sp. QJM3NY_33]|uniref:radical SAM protein n=1 Tax=Agarivorans sp. QJM3NY_33 TaxID=3421432 RepID=UPI003D7C81C1
MNTDIQMKTMYSANVSLWLNCNLRCTYCFANPIQPPKVWPSELEEQLQKMEAFFNRTGTWTLVFSGGEPAIYPGFADFCVRLANAGHKVQFFTNGTVPLFDVFDDQSIQSLERVLFSYHPIHEKNQRLDKLFDDNIRYLQSKGVATSGNYVLYPDRADDPKAIRERYENLNVDFRFSVFQGEYQDQMFPFDYSEQEKADFAEVADLRSRYMMEHGYYIPTFKVCEAGRKTFYVSLRTGGVYLCEQLQQKSLANIYSETCADDFQQKVSPKPVICPAKRCSCRLTIPQEQFLQENDLWDQSKYPEWEQISLPKPEALKKWEGAEKAFTDELKSKVKGNVVYLWGGGVHALVLMRQLARWNFPMEKIAGIIDTNPLRQGREMLNKRIVKKAVLSDPALPKCSDIIISSRAFESNIFEEIELSFGEQFNVIRLYDGNFKNQFESIEVE